MHRVGLRAGLIMVLLLVSLPAVAQPTGLPDDLTGDHEAQGFADLLFAHGMLAFAEGDYATALPLFDKAARTMPTDATYEYYAALCRLQLGEYGRAAEGFRNALPPAASRIGEARIRYDLGDSYFRNGEIQLARNELRRSTDLDDKIAPAQFYRGLADFSEGDTDTAIMAFSRAADIDPSYAKQPDFVEGMAAFEAGDLEKSQTHFQQVWATTSQAGSRQWLVQPDSRDGGDDIPRSDVRFTFVMEHDDNPGQVNQDIAIPDVRTDVRGVVQGRASYRPWIKEQSTIDAVINTYVSRHADFTTADLVGVQGVVQFAIGGDPTGYASGPLGFARVTPTEKRLSWLLQAGAGNLARRQGSLRRDYEIAATAFLQQPDFGKTEASVTYDDIHYFDASNSDYSGHATSFRVGQYFFLGKGASRYLRVSVGRTMNVTRERAFRRDSTVYQTEVSLPLAAGFHLFLMANFREDDYDAASQKFYGISSARLDETVEAIAKMTMTVSDRSYLTFGYGFADRDNPEVMFANYDRRIASVGFTFSWK